ISARRTRVAAAQSSSTVRGVAVGDDDDAPESNQPYGSRSEQALSDLAFGKRVRVVVHDMDRSRLDVAITQTYLFPTAEAQSVGLNLATAPTNKSPRSGSLSPYARASDRSAFPSAGPRGRTGRSTALRRGGPRPISGDLTAVMVTARRVRLVFPLGVRFEPCRP